MLYVKNSLKGLFAFASTFLIQITVTALYFVIVVGIGIFSGEKDSSFVDKYTTTDSAIMLSLVYSVIAMLLFGYWYYKRFAKRKYESLKDMRIQNRLSVPCIFFLLLSIIFLEFFCGYITEIIEKIYPASITLYEDLLDRSGMIDTSSLPAILYVCILGPICEELVYRGVIFYYGMNTNKIWFANLLQATLFGLMHGNLLQFSYAFILGLFLGLIVSYTNSIKITILIHIGFNTLSLFFSNTLTPIMSKVNCVLGLPIFGILSYLAISVLIESTKKIEFR